MAVDTLIESDINDLVNFAIDQEIISLDEAEGFVRDLVAAYANGAAYREDDETLYDDLPPLGFRRVKVPPIDKLERQFVWLRYKIEEDPTWETNPLLSLFEQLECAVFLAMDEQELAVRRLQEFSTGSMH